MPRVKIIAPPAGEAPLHVREAWVGLVLPLKAKFEAKPSRIPRFSVLSSPKSAIGQIFGFLLGRHDGMLDAYWVDPIGAIEVLKKKDPAAAEWWLTNAPHAIRANRSLVFEVEVCEFLSDE